MNAKRRSCKTVFLSKYVIIEKAKQSQFTAICLRYFRASLIYNKIK